MYINIYREFYKLLHRKVAWFAPFLILCMMIAMGLSVGKNQPKLLIMTNFASSQVILFALVIVASSIFSMEFQNNAILNVLYKSPNKLQVFLSKVIVIIIYNIYLHILSIIITMILSMTQIVSSFSWLDNYQYNQPLLLNMINNTLIDLVTSTFIISIIFLISCIINNNAVVVTINFVLIFMGSYISYSLLLQDKALSRILRWNPLNMINLTQQYYTHIMINDTQLTILQLLLSTIFYTIIFFIFGYEIFSKKRF